VLGGVAQRGAVVAACPLWAPELRRAQVDGKVADTWLVGKQAASKYLAGARPRTPLQANHSTDAQRATIFLAASR
jgi:hypothetical protein